VSGVAFVVGDRFVQLRDLGDYDQAYYELLAVVERYGLTTVEALGLLELVKEGLVYPSVEDE
jgi:hypothetical protein